MWDWFHRKSPAVIGEDWDTSASKATLCCVSCWLKPHRSPCGANPSGAASSSHGYAPGEKDRESRHGAQTRGSSVLDVAQGMGLRTVEKARCARGRARKSPGC